MAEKSKCCFLEEFLSVHTAELTSVVLHMVLKVFIITVENAVLYCCFQFLDFKASFEDESNCV